VAGPARRRALLAVARRGAVDDARVHLLHVLEADPEPRDDPRAEALDHDVGALREPQERGLPRRRLQVEPHALRAAAARIGEEAGLELHAAPLRRRADLHDRRAVVAEDARAARRRPDRREVEHGDAGEGRPRGRRFGHGV